MSLSELLGFDGARAIGVDPIEELVGDNILECIIGRALDDTTDDRIHPLKRFTGELCAA